MTDEILIKLSTVGGNRQIDLNYIFHKYLHCAYTKKIVSMEMLINKIKFKNVIKAIQYFNVFNDR